MAENTQTVNKSTILIVDDETELLLSLQRPLQMKYNVITMDKSTEVMDNLRALPVDCILLDIRMPGLTGIELLKEIKFSYPHIPVLIMTGHGGEEDTITSLKYGASGYLKKPIDLSLLFNEIQRVLTLTGKSEEAEKPVHILLVDDDPEILKSIVRALAHYGYKMSSYTKTEEALSCLDSDNFDIIIVDMNMPSMNGFEFIDQAKKKSSNFVPILLTGFSTQELAIDAIKHDVFDYIRKPLDVSELVSAIERSMKKLEINREIHQKNRELTAKEKLLENLNNEIVIQKNYLENIVQSISNILIITDETGKIKTVNDSAIRSLGYAAHELADKPIDIIFQIKNLQKYMEKLTQEKGIFNVEAEYLKKGGEKIYVLYSSTLIRNQYDKTEGFVFVAQDISSRKAMEEELQQLSYYDSLTKLPNRLFFEMQAKQLLVKAGKNNELCALLYLDLDGFKGVNDRLGHPIGDKLLREIASRFESAFRKDDFAARIGGDEFVVFLSNIEDKASAGIVAQRLIALINKPVFIENNEISLGASIGIAIFPSSANDFEQLFKNSDIALYKAKHAGRNQYHYFTQQLNMEYGRQLEVENALRFALNRDEFHMAYQPIFDLEAKKIIAIEALIRWDSAEFGTISPQDFIPVAEYIGLMNPIGEWAMETALKQYAELKENHDIDFKLAINLSSSQLGAKDYLKNFLNNTCSLYQLTPEDIQLELTETAIMHNPKQSELTLKTLHQEGFILSLDDFGQGSSSLSLISRLPISILKIDKQFISGLNDEKNVFIIKSILSLADGLALNMVAEGIETKEEYEYLKKLRCLYGQGYYFCEPKSLVEFIKYLESN